MTTGSIVGEHNPYYAGLGRSAFAAVSCISRTQATRQERPSPFTLHQSQTGRTGVAQRSRQRNYTAHSGKQTLMSSIGVSKMAGARLISCSGSTSGSSSMISVTRSKRLGTCQWNQCSNASQTAVSQRQDCIGGSSRTEGCSHSCSVSFTQGATSSHTFGCASTRQHLLHQYATPSLRPPCPNIPLRG